MADEQKDWAGRGKQRSVDDPPAYRQDRFFYRAIALALGATAFVSATGSVLLLAFAGFTEIPNAVVALGSAAIGALAGVLVQHK